MKKFIFFATLFLSLSCFSQITPAPFDSLAQVAKLDFTMPEGCSRLSIPFMHKVPHNLAVGPADSSYQVRYWVQPLDTWVADYNKKSKKEQKNSLHPNALCKSMMLVAVLNASDNQFGDFQLSPYPDLTKKIYNADWEAMSLVPCMWPEIKFKYCYIWCLHKDDIGDVYLSILANAKEDLLNIYPKIASTLKFR